MDFQGQRDQLDTLCGEMESCGIDDFHALVGKWRSNLHIGNISPRN